MPRRNTESNDLTELDQLPDDGTPLTPEEEALQIVKDEEERVAVLDKLAERITNLFCERAKQRVTKEVEWHKAWRLYNTPLQGSSLDIPDRPFDTNVPKNGYRRPEPNIVRTKCDTAIANSVSMQFAGGTEKNWDLFPPPNTQDPAVTNACRLMEKEIEAQLANTKYAMHCRRAMEDRVILGTGVVKGPINTGKMKVKYVQDASGQWVPEVTTEYEPQFEHVPVWRFYPDMTVNNFHDCTDSVEIHPWTALELSQYAEHPGFDKDAILSILRGNHKYEPIKPDIYNATLNNITAEMWQQNPYLYQNRYVILEYHGPVTYDELSKLGLEPTYESPTQEYYGEVWVCCGKVIRMELENIEGYYETPYGVSIWKRDPSSVFGYGHPLLLQDPQRVITEAYHMILDNASLTSGPQIAMYQKYIQPIDGDWTISPNKVWLLTDPTADVDKAIKFFNPTNVIGNIMPVMELARRFADEESATSSIAAGLPSPDVSQSATGEMLMRQSSTTLLDFLSEEWDDQITEKVIRRYYAWNMQYNPRQDIKGNYIIDVRSASEYKNKQMYVRDLERLSMEAAQNPIMQDLVNMDELYKARLSMMKLPSNRIMKNEQEIAAAQQARQQQPNPAMLELELKAREVQVKEQELKLKGAQLQFELQQQQQRELWEHEEKMGSNQARLAEAQAQVLKARSEVQVEMIQLAAKDRQFAAKLNSDKEIANLSVQADVFLESLKQQTKTQENSLFQQELDLKRSTGEGI